MTFTHALGTNNYGSQKFIVATSPANGTHTTLASALTAASSGDTIYLRDSVTENVTLKAGVNITSYTNASITGKCTFSSAGSVALTGITFITNSDFILVISGSAASGVNFKNCYLNCLNNTGISLTSTGGSSFRLEYCNGNIATTGISLFAVTGTGATCVINYSTFENTGNSTTASTISSGLLSITDCRIVFAITTSSGSDIQAQTSEFLKPSSSITNITHNGTGGNSYLSRCQCSSGSSSAVSIGSGASLTMAACTISSSNSNIVTGAGSLFNGGIFGSGDIASASIGINTSTVTGRNLAVGGITFDNSANILNVYTTGTFTPTISPTSGTFTTITYSFQVGYYTKIGDTAFVSFNVGLSAFSIGTGASDIRMTGLPFTSLNISTLESQGALRIGGLTYSQAELWAELGPNFTHMLVQGASSTTAASNVQASGLSSSTGLLTNIFYKV